MTLVLDQLGRLLGIPRRDGPSRCMVCNRPIQAGQRSMTIRGSVEVHQGCATYRMRRADAAPRRLGYPPR